MGYFSFCRRERVRQSGGLSQDPGHIFLRKPQQSPRLLVTLSVLVLVWVGEPGIEPGPHGPKPRTLPLCYTPTQTGTEIQNQGHSK